jgi:1,4-dihydroxy-2-naphthoate octaprenyltransferase
MMICQLAGFLGSGKTTLIVRLGKELGRAGKKVAIIVTLGGLATAVVYLIFRGIKKPVVLGAPRQEPATPRPFYSSLAPFP